MEALEAKLSEPLEADRSPDSHMKTHEVRVSFQVVLSRSLAEVIITAMPS